MKTEAPPYLFQPDASESRAEAVLLGACLIDPVALTKAAAVLQESDFSTPGRRAVFAAMSDLSERPDTTVDIVSVTQLLREEGRLSLAGGVAGVARLVEGLPHGVNVASLVRSVRGTASRRLMADALNAGWRALEAGNRGVDAAAVVETEIGHVLSEGQQAELQEAPGDIPGVLEESVEASTSKDHSGLFTGFPGIDQILLGLQNGDAWYLAARPSQGKSSLMSNILLHLTLGHGKKCALVSLENTVRKIVRRLLAQLAMIDSNLVRKGRLTPQQWALVYQAAVKLKNMPLWIDDSRPLSVGRMRAKLKRLHAEVGLDFVCIDYLQLLSSGMKKMKASDQSQEVAAVSHAIKSLAGELDLPVLALSQMNRSIETGQGERRPRLSDLRDTGALEQDADIVSFLYPRKDENGQPTGVVEHIVEKARDGATGIGKLVFVKRLTRFFPGSPSVVAA